MVDYQRRSVFYFEEKQKVHVERYSRKRETEDANEISSVRQDVERCEIVHTSDLQKAMTRGTPLAKLVDKYHAIKERNPDVKRCHTLKT